MNAPNGGSAVAPALTDFILLNEEIAALVRARLPLESHLARLGTELPGTAAQLAKRIGARLDHGETLAAAMGAECAAMPPAYRAVIVAGVEGGQLAAALESLVETTTRIDQLRRVTGVAILYPLFIAIIVCLLFAMMLGVVIPQFGWLKESHFWPLDRLTGMPWVIATLAVVAPSAILLGAAAWWWRSRRLDGFLSSGFVLARLPGLRRVFYWGRAAVMADLLRLLLERGLPLDRALCLAADVTGEANIRAAAGNLAEQSRQGMIAPATTDADGRPSGFPRLIRLALRHASDRKLMAASLQQAADLYRERAIRAAEWYAEAMPILLTIGVGGTLTVAFTLLVMWPYASALHELAGWNWR